MCLSMVVGRSSIGQSPVGQSPGARDHAVALALVGLVFVVHVLSPIRTSFDSRWAIHTAVSLAYRGDTDLGEYDDLLREDEYYAIEHRDGREFTRYPIGPSLLAVPVVVVWDLIARLTAKSTAEDLIKQHRAVALEVVVASLVVGLTTGIVYSTARLCGLRLALAGVLALVFAFCTPAWSTASRGLWQHGPSMLTVSSGLYLLLLARRCERYAALAALPLAFGYLVRPTNAIPLAVFAAYVAVRHPRQIVSFASVSALVIGTFLVLNLRGFGAPLPSYFLPSGQSFGAWSEVPWNLAGHLVSPNRGLFVFSPVLLLAIAGVVLELRRGTLDLLDGAVLTVLAGHFLVISITFPWWAGHSFGPRFTTDVLPLLAYLMIPAVAAVSALRPPVKQWLSAVLIVLTAWSFFAQYRAATRWDVWAWNGTPVSIDDRPDRAWDWTDLQILRGLGRAPDER